MKCTNSLKNYKPAELIQEEIDNLNRSLPSKFNEFVDKNIPAKVSADPDDFNGQFL